MNKWTIATIGAAVMGLSLISASPSSARGNDQWRGDGYSRNDGCNDHDRYSGNHRRHDRDGERRYGWGGNGGGNDGWYGNRRGGRDGDHRWRGGDNRWRDHDGDRGDRHDGRRDGRGDGRGDWR